MELKNMLEDQMATPLWFFRFPPPWMAVLAPLLILMALMGFGFFSIFLTSLVLILSSVSFTFSTRKHIRVEKLEKVPIRSDQRILPPCLEDESKDSKKQEAQEQGMYPADRKCSPEVITALPESLPNRALIAPPSLPDLTSENECPDDHLSTSDDSEIDWSFEDNVVRSPDFSDGSISDEDSLIEIDLPGGYYVAHKEKEPAFNLQQKMPGLSHQSIFQQHTFLELLAEINEMNEEENLFEIDLSMGSIKCSRFEIEA